MGFLGVDTAGLQALAKQAEGLASELGGLRLPIVEGNPWQSTVAAVDTVNASVSCAAQTLAGQLSATAANLESSSALYASQNERDASSIRTVEL